MENLCYLVFLLYCWCIYFSIVARLFCNQAVRLQEFLVELWRPKGILSGPHSTYIDIP